MTKKQPSKTVRSGTKATGRKRAAPITDWLGFIRPHLEIYSTLPWGEQKEFIEKLARKEGQSVNTLRRYIAAAEFLEVLGITRFPENVERMPVAAVETIRRISRISPAHGRALLDDLMRGIGTIRSLKEQLAAISGRRRIYSSAQISATVGSMALEDLEAEIRFVVADMPDMLDFVPSKLSVHSFKEWHGPSHLFAKGGRPSVVVPLLEDRVIAVFDEGALWWSRSPARAVRDFLQNIIKAATMFDVVMVYCQTLKDEVAVLIAAMHQECRRRIHLRPRYLGWRLGR